MIKNTNILKEDDLITENKRLRAENYCLRGALVEADRMLDALTEQLPNPVAEVVLLRAGGNAGLATRIVEIYDPEVEPLREGQLLYTAPVLQDVLRAIAIRKGENP